MTEENRGKMGVEEVKNIDGKRQRGRKDVDYETGKRIR